MDTATIQARVQELARCFAGDRAARQRRVALDPEDLAALREAGFPLLAVPAAEGGAFESIPRSVRPLCQVLRTLAAGDSSLALVCAMHPAVLSYWLAFPSVPPPDDAAWEAQRRWVAAQARAGAFFGTITSEPGSGGDIARTRARARKAPGGGGYLLDGEKHFGSGSGVAAFMITSAVPEGDERPEPDWFLLDLRGVPFDGSAGVTLVSPWEGHGMAATQSHGLRFSSCPALRVAWPGHRADISAATGPFIGCLFASVIAGVVDAAVAQARALVTAPGRGAQRPFERVEWTRAEIDAWLIHQALEGMLRAVEAQPQRAREVAQGKLAISELAEACLQRICRVLGGGAYSRRSPFGHWFEDVRALGFLRPPWGLAFDVLAESEGA